MDHSFQYVLGDITMGILLAVIIALIAITLIVIDIVSRVIDVHVKMVHHRLEISLYNSATRLEQTKVYSILAWFNLVNVEEGN